MIDDIAETTCMRQASKKPQTPKNTYRFHFLDRAAYEGFPNVSTANHENMYKATLKMRNRYKRKAPSAPDHIVMVCDAAFTGRVMVQVQEPDDSFREFSPTTDDLPRLLAIYDVVQVFRALEGVPDEQRRQRMIDAFGSSELKTAAQNREGRYLLMRDRKRRWWLELYRRAEQGKYNHLPGVSDEAKEPDSQLTLFESGPELTPFP